jgi:phage recombination protein Bet
METPSLQISEKLDSALRAEYGAKATDAQWTIFVEFAKLRRLMPGRDIHLQIHNTNDWDADNQCSVKVKKASYITSIGALQTIAMRTGEYVGRKPTVYFYTNGKELFSRPEPWAQDGDTFFGAQVTVMRKGMPDTVFFARHDAYVATYRKGGVEHVNSMWQKRGPEQTAKCAFSGALREAFPEDLAGLYSNEEMARVIDDEREDKPETAYVPQPPVAVPHIVVPTMSAAPATVEGNKPLPVVSQAAPLAEETREVIKALFGADTADAIVAPKSLNDDISTWAPVDDPMLPSGAVVPTADNPAAFEPTEAQLLARAALKSVPKHKLGRPYDRAAGYRCTCDAFYNRGERAADRVCPVHWLPNASLF